MTHSMECVYVTGKSKAIVADPSAVPPCNIIEKKLEPILSPMLRTLRHKLWMIRYYSARRHETAWSRAMDAALVVSLLLALPATWFCDAAAMQSRVAVDVPGLLTIEADGSYAAWLMRSESGRQPRQQAKPAGNFSLTADVHRHGWPLTTSTHLQPATLDLDILSEVQARKNATLPPDSPWRLAIEQALREEQQETALYAWSLPATAVDYFWLAWAGATALWWIMLTLASGLMINLVRFSVALWKRRRSLRAWQRRAEGKCLACGYDLTGLEFNERCPECGEIVW